MWTNKDNNVSVGLDWQWPFIENKNKDFTQNNGWIRSQTYQEEVS